jgi:hypothetical protein
MTRTGRPPVTIGETTGHVGLRLPKAAVEQLNAHVAKLNNAVKEATGVENSLTVSKLLRSWVLERLAGIPK